MTLAISGYVSDQIKQLTHGVAELNQKMAGVMQRVVDQEKQLDFLSRRMDKLEVRKR